MNDDPIVVPTIAFWILGPLSAIAPLRWSVVLFLLLIQVDMSGLGNFSTSSLGVDNAIKVALIPTILLIRARRYIHFTPAMRKLGMFWLLFVAYACLAVAWTSDHVSAVKMIGYLYAYTVLFVVFTTAWQQNWFNRRTLTFILWISLSAAVIQTYFLGNAFGSDPFQWRFTTFAGAQSFAPFLLSLLVLLLFRETFSLSIAAAVCGAGAGILLTGSRSVFLGLVWVLSLYGIFSAVRSSRQIQFGMIAKRAVWVAAILAVTLAVVINYLPENRLNEMVAAAVEKNATLDDVGTFGWRFSLYQKTIDELLHRNPLLLLVGSGTSSGANLVLDENIFQEDNVDPNRALHDEFLRTVYEWGLIGLFALLAFFYGLVKLAISMVKLHASRDGWAFLAIAVPLLISLTVENVLAESGSPSGVGYNLVLTCLVAGSALLPEPAPLGDAATLPAISSPAASTAILSENCEGQ